jgi:hypothetical protein
LTEALASVAAIGSRTFENAGKKKVPLALVEAMLVAIFANRKRLSSVDDGELQRAFQNLQNEPTFVESARYAVSSAENVNSRIRQAIASFEL